MEQNTLAIAALGAALAAAYPAYGQNSQSVQGTASTSTSGFSTSAMRSGGQSDSLQHLQRATDNLYKAIQAIAQKPVGEERNRAIDEAHQAAFEAQRAMIALPPELRRTSGSPATATRDAAAQEREMARLKAAAQSLREATQSMAQQPAGDRRNRAIDQANQALFDVQQSMVAVASYQNTTGSGRPSAGSGARSSAESASQPARTSGNAQQTTNAGAAPDAFGIVVVPLQMANSEALNNGCWARLHENPEFSGNTLTLVGPVDVPDLKRTAAHDWNGVDSLVVGPSARVTAYEGESYAQKAITVDAGKRIGRLRQTDQVSYLGRLESVKVACTGSARG